MEIYKIIYAISALAWFCPIFRQFKGNFFYYFLILGLTDPLNILNAVTFQLIDVNHFIVISSLLLFFVIQYGGKNFLNNWLIKSILTLIVISLMLYLPKIEFLVVAIRSLILFNFIKKTVLLLHSTGELNFFYLVLSFYELTIVINFIVHFGRTDVDIVVFLSTFAFQVLIAIFFSIFREDSPLLTLRLKVIK
ncbi:hypothetical protein ACFLSS_03980 [Bacteroidota bacterium]